MDKKQYEKFAEKSEKEFEAICSRCGECCGAGNGPCKNLKKLEDDTYICRSYKDRLGAQETVSGQTFNCVSIREHIRNKTLPPGCSYRK